MSFPLLRALNYSCDSKCATLMAKSPHRILALDSEALLQTEETKEGEGKVEKINYLSMSLKTETIFRDLQYPLPKPESYFHSPHTLVKSILYLTDQTFYEQAHLPKKRETLVRKALTKKLEGLEKNKRGAKKLIQALMGTRASLIDSDPCFLKQRQLIFETFASPFGIIIVHSDPKGYFLDTTPKKLPKRLKASSDKKRKTYLVILQLPTGLFAPYGRVHT